jgi:DNA end-binding protein Ku
MEGIDQRFFDTPYYITPNEPVGQEAFAVIREAMRGKALVALGRIVLAKRERLERCRLLSDPCRPHHPFRGTGWAAP